MATTVKATPAEPTNKRAVAVRLVALLGIATLLLFVSNGRNSVPIAAWLAPVFLLRFFRLASFRIATATAAVALYSTWMYQFRGMVPAPRPIVLLVAASFTVAALGPYVLDRVLAHRVSAVTTTLIFPAGCAAISYISSLASPYGTWGDPAYSQYGVLPLIQLVSVFGLAGLCFLIGWFASVVNYAWERNFDWKRVRTQVGVYLVVAIGVLLWGGLRLAYLAPASVTVRIASLSRGRFQMFPNDAAEERFSRNELTAQDIESMKQLAARANDDLLLRSEREAQAGAKIVFWAEATAWAFEGDDEAALIAKAQEVARRNNIYLGLGAGINDLQSSKPLQNRMILIRPDGSIAYDYWKARPVPGGEMAVTQTNDGKLKWTDSPYGRLSSTICFDMDFATLLRQTTPFSPDIMLVPSNDWSAIDPWHTQMATFRAIEYGFNLVRQVRSGYSMAVDYQGRVLASVDWFRSPEGTLVAQVPIQGTRTVYSRIGDSFAWLCIAALIVLPLGGRRRRK